MKGTKAEDEAAEAVAKPAAKDDEGKMTFAEGVKYGEELEKKPGEREKLDKEHESEGMKKPWVKTTNFLKNERPCFQGSV